jgi:hypothetical protein
MTKWISVDENLPETRKMVIVMIDHRLGDYWHMKYHKGPELEVTHGRVDFIDNEGWPNWNQGRYASGTPINVLEYITHWQDYPQAEDFGVKDDE